MQFEERITISATANKVFTLYSEVGSWSSWDSEVKSSSIEGAFVSGAKGTISPSGGPKTNIVFVQVVPNRSFVVESYLPLCVMRFEHDILEAEAKSVTVVHRVIFKGILSPLFGRLIGYKIKEGMPKALLSLKRAAEKNG